MVVFYTENCINTATLWRDPHSYQLSNQTICLLVCIGAVVDTQQQYVDCEFILGLKEEVDHEACYQLMKDYNVEKVNMWNVGGVKMVHVRGSETDVIQVSHLRQVLGAQWYQLHPTMRKCI